MGLKSKSVVTIIILAFVGILAFGTGAYMVTRAKSTRFASDGYILMAEAAGDADSTVTSSPVWFGAGKAYTSGTSGVSFTDAQGNAVTVDEDSFVHYTDDSVSAVKNTVVMDLDNYVQDYIQYYYLEQGSAIAGDNGAYYIRAQEDAPSFSNFLMKSSDLHYLLGSPTMYFVRSSDTAETTITTGYVEITYLADDYSIALINDGSSAWQMLTENAYIQLENGVKFDLSSGALSYGGSESGEASTYYVGEIDVDVNLNVEVYSSTVYPTYRFTVVNGADGADGEDGDYGDNGEEGTRGEQGETGADGTTAGDGIAGENGGIGSSGSIAEDGYSGGVWDGIEVVGKVPVVQIREWSIAGSVLHFIAYMDEDSCDQIEENTSSILLEDLDNGSSMEWDENGDLQGQSVDFSEDNSDGFEFYYNQIVPGHSYRMTISATYTLNGVKNTQALLVRNFTADDYGVVFNRTASDNTSATYSIELTNSNVELDKSGTPVTVTVNGADYDLKVDNWNADALKEIEIRYDLLNPDSEESVNYAGQEMDIVFTVNLIVNSYNYAEKEYQMSGKETLTFEDSVTVRKSQPTVGGIRLTAYNSGLFLAELLGKYNTDTDSYDEVDDADEAITAIRFELYSGIEQKDNATCATLDNLVETIEVTSGYIGYFPVTESEGGGGVTLGQYYYVRAYCIINDGEMVSELPVKETRAGIANDETWISTIRDRQYKHAKDEMAWDYAILNNITSTSISFVGMDGIYNTADNTQNPGITFNRIKGSIYAVISANSDYYISTDCPIEIQVSASPDYYVSLKYDNIDSRQYAEVSEGRYVYDVKEVTGQDEGRITNISKVNDSSNAIVLKLPIDLTGLKANTTYLINMYGYENPTGGNVTGKSDLDRVIMGSMAISTADTRNITVKLSKDTRADANGEIGCILTLGDGTDSFYDSKNGTYTNDQAYMKGTDASYRSLSSITLNLYREADKTLDSSATDTLVGTCVINSSEDKYPAGSDSDHNTLYEQFYGTRTPYAIGVGKSFTYQFTDPKNKLKTLTTDDLNDGTYYIVVSGACDYTEARYNNYLTSDTSTYTYYGWRSDKSQYINELVINGGVEEKVRGFRHTSIPYMLPSALKNSSDNSYITVEPITNSEAAICNPTDKSLYCESWDANTVAGLKLTTNYRQKGEGTAATTLFTYYGFTEKAYDAKKTSGEALIDSTSDNYFFKFEFSLSANAEKTDDYAPEIWLMFYDPKVNTDIADDLDNKKLDKSVVGYIYSTVITNPDTSANCPTVQVIYMDASYFSRGNSYYFAYDAELADYEWTCGDETKKSFHYPSDYYTYLDDTAEYDFSTSLKSGKVTVNRQTPVVYSWLENTDSTGADNWSVYISDPDNAIEWESLLNAPLLNEYDINKGGIYGYSQKLTTTLQLASSEEGKYYTTISSDAVTEAAKTANPDLTTANIVSSATLSKFAANLTKEGGGKLRVSGMPDKGLIYNVYLNYTLQKGGDEKLLRVISHNYMGSVTINGDDTSAQTFQLQLDDTNSDHNTMRIYLGVPAEAGSDGNVTPRENMDACYLESTYLSKIESIAAVRIRAKVKKAGTEDAWTDIMEQELQEDGTYAPGSTVKDVWVAPTAPSKTTTTEGVEGYSDYRYYLEFELSDFDDTGNTQYSVGDSVSFDVQIYYATGESVIWTEASDGSYSIDTTTAGDANGETTGYVARYVDHASAQKKLYESGETRIWGSYVLAEGIITRDFDLAGKSFYKITGNMTEWTQSIKLASDTFNRDYAVSHKADLKKNLSVNANQIVKESSDAIEILKTKTASYSNDEVLTTQVKSFVPKLENFTATPGLTTVNITAAVKNASLVDCPDGERFHMYYLVYKVENGADGQETKTLVGAMIGKPVTNGTLNLDFDLSANTKYRIEIYYKEKGTLENAAFDQYTDSHVFGNKQTQVGDNLHRWDPAEAGVFYKAADDPDLIQMAAYIETQIKGTYSNIFRPVEGLSESASHVTTNEGIQISSTKLTLNTSTTPVQGAQTDAKTTIADGRTLQLTTEIGSTIIDAEQPKLRIFYQLERCEQSTYNAAQSGTNGENAAWETVIADKNDPAVTQALGAEHYWQYYEADTGYVPNPDAIGSTNTMEMRYYTGGVIRPGYYYRVTTRVYKMVTGSDGTVTYENVTIGSSAVSAPELWAGADAVKVNPVLSYAESDTITVTFVFYDSNNTSVDGKYFVRLAQLQADGTTWKVLEKEDGVEIENSDMTYDQAYYMGKSYSMVKFTGVQPSSTYRLQFYAAFDSDYDNHIDTMSGNFNVGILNIGDYYAAGAADATPTSNLIGQSGAYKEAFDSVNPYNNTGSLKFAGSGLLAGTSAQISTVAAGQTAYAGNYGDICTVNENASNSISLRYMGAFNTDQIAVITYEVGLKTTAGANVTYVSHDIYANDTQAVYGSYTFTDTKGNAATNGKVLLNLTLNTESEVVEDNSQSKPLNFNSNTGEYTVTLYFYRAKRDMNGNILTDSSGNPVPEDQPLQKDGVTFTVQKQ